MNLRWIAGMVSLVFGACGGRVSGDSGTEASGGTTNSTGSGGKTTTTTNVSAGGMATTATATGGTGTVIACPGVPGAEPTLFSGADDCNATIVEVDRLPVDLVFLVDRSYSTGFAFGTNETSLAGTGQLRRWDALRFAMESLASAPEAAWLRGSFTFFGLGGVTDANTCNANDYVQTAISLDWLSLSVSTITATMQSIVPAGVSPTVPALRGTYMDAMHQQAGDPSREKVVVLLSDGWPTACAVNVPLDVSSEIAAAATAPVPIRTFIVGVGSAATLEATKDNLRAFADAGGTGKPAYLLDDTLGVDSFRQQFVTTMLDIAQSPRACEYKFVPISNDWPIDPEEVMFVYRSDAGSVEEIPRLVGEATCPRSPNGGWYFANPLTSSKITVCPCTCANYGRRTATVVSGCKPPVFIE